MTSLPICPKPSMGPQQDLSSPEDETGSAFHTPKHIYGTNANASSMYSVLTSQDSIDVFHDAISTLHLPLPSLIHSPRKSHLVQPRRRHFSSGAKFEEEKIGISSNSTDWEEETDEQTCMLPKDPVVRVRHSSHGPGQISKSCNCSPFHLPRLSLSTNSLKRRSLDKMIRLDSPQKQKSDEKGETGTTGTNFVPYVEVDMIKESDEVETKNDHHTDTPKSMRNGVIPSLLANSIGFQASNHVDGGGAPKERLLQFQNGGDPSQWKEHYVPCTELQTFLCDGHYKQCKGEAAITREEHHLYASKPIRRKKSTIQRVKEEFSLSNFKFNHKAPHLFVTSQWQQPDHMCCMYLAYRLFWGVYFTMWAVWSWIGYAGYDSPVGLKAYYLIYLTNWAIWLLAFDTMLQAINVAMHMRKISVEGGAKYSSMKTAFKTSWILSNITSTLHIFVTLLFWITVYSPKRPLNTIGVNIHIIPCVYVILDSLVSATPRRIFHAYLPIGFLTTYGFFTNVYYFFGGVTRFGSTKIYPLLDWSEPSKTWLIAVGLFLLVIPMIHTFVVFIYALRVKLWHNLNYTRYDHEVIESVQSISMEEKV